MKPQAVLSVFTEEDQCYTSFRTAYLPLSSAPSLPFDPIPLAKNMTAKQPMPKEVACVNNLALENYIRSVMSEVPYDDFFRGVHNNDDFLTYDEVTGKLTTLTQNYLLKPSNWISSQAWRRIVENTVAILNDEEAIFKAGRNIFNSAAGLRHALLRFVSAQTIFNRLPKENAKYNKNKRVEIVENKPGHAIVRLHWMDMGTIWGTMVKS